MKKQRSFLDATHAVLSVQHMHRHLSKRLRDAWDSVKSWKAETSVSLRPPLPEPIMRAMVNACFVRGFGTHKHEAHLWIPLGVLILVGFHALLRPIEFDELLRLHVVLPSNTLLGLYMQSVLTVSHPKNRRFGSRMQFRMIKDYSTLMWLEWLCSSLPSSAKLFPLSLPEVRRLFKLLCRDLGLTEFGFVPASLRAGGATHLYLTGIPVDQLRFIGGWTSVVTLEHYIQEAMSVRMLLQLTPATQLQLKALLCMFPHGALPPTEPWWVYFSRNAKRPLC